MTIKLVKETKLDDAAWYSVYKDDKYISGSYLLHKAEEVYNKVKNSVEIHKIEILKTEEIVVSLDTNSESNGK